MNYYWATTASNRQIKPTANETHWMSGDLSIFSSSISLASRAWSSQLSGKTQAHRSSSINSTPYSYHISLACSQIGNSVFCHLVF